MRFSLEKPTKNSSFPSSCGLRAHWILFIAVCALFVLNSSIQNTSLRAPNNQELQSSHSSLNSSNTGVSKIEPEPDTGSTSDTTTTSTDTDSHAADTQTTKDVTNLNPKSSPSDETNNNGAKTHTKPKLIFHVGPRKTASTTIQQRILNKQFYSHHKKEGEGGVLKGGLKETLEEDNYYIIPFDYGKYNKVVENYFEKGPEKGDATMWRKLMGLYEEEYAQGHNVIHSIENMALIPKNDFTKGLYQALAEKWDVQVVVVYRPFHSWLPSFYTELRKTKIYQVVDKGAYWTQPDRLTEPFTTWLDSFTNTKEAWEAYWMKEGDPLGCVEWWSEVFGKDKIITIDLMHHAKNDIRFEFACKTLTDAPKSCARAEKRLRTTGKVMHLNSSPDRILDMDLLVQTAYDEGVIPRNVKNLEKVYPTIPRDLERGAVISRTASLRVLEYKLMALNMTVHDLPKKCINDEQFDMIVERALATEEYMASQPVPKETIEEYVKTNHKFCSVDTDAVFQNETLLEMLTSKDYFMDEYNDDFYPDAKIVPHCKEKCGGNVEFQENWKTVKKRKWEAKLAEEDAKA